MTKHIEGREIVIRNLREELMGPSVKGTGIDTSGVLSFPNYDEYMKPKYQLESGQEIIIGVSPNQKYGVGILYPIQTILGSSEREFLDTNEDFFPDHDTANESIPSSNDGDLDEESFTGEESGELDLSTAYSYNQSAMAVSFMIAERKGLSLEITISGGRYKHKEVHYTAKKEHDMNIEEPVEEKRIPGSFWIRRPVEIKACIPTQRIISSSNICNVHESDIETPPEEDLDLDVQIYSRFTPAGRIVTVSVTNRTESSGRKDEKCLFQTNLKVRLADDSGNGHILPYPSASTPEPTETSLTYSAEYANLIREEESLSLLYLNNKTYGVGHGCAAMWDEYIPRDDEILDEKYLVVSEVRGEALPEYQIPNITPDISDDNNNPVTVSMADLANINPPTDGFESLQAIVDEYSKWIEKKSKEVEKLPEENREAAKRHMEDCEACLKRMISGISFLKSNKNALKAFELANHAILLQQIASSGNLRPTVFNATEKRWETEGTYPEFDPNLPPEGIGKWRAFQIGFLLTTVENSVGTNAANDHDRRTVDLIWFPTGGGKTEAYLGLAAFTIFFRRLEDPTDTGIQTLMRYTLRLLTAQQFQRAAGLTCAMEFLRRTKYKDLLGDTPFAIGVWLGGEITPNTRARAKQSYRNMLDNKSRARSENPFVLLSCPWCQAQIGPVKNTRGGSRRTQQTVVGYEENESTIIFVCPDRNCTFRAGIPVYVIDEDIYEKRPDIVIGTVDKFAMLAWGKQYRSIFGLDESGERFCSPPGLIIQDELHLISGPLGSMVGLYETVIEEFCTDRRNGKVIPPKIIASTATIRRYEHQIKALYGRESVNLFPPPGLDAGNSFFARYHRNEDGYLSPGRKYIGIFAPSLGSSQTTQVRSFTPLLQSILGMSAEEQDPWYTLMIFYNSLRELGGALSLFQSDIPVYQEALRRRGTYNSKRNCQPRELTGRLASNEVVEFIDALKVGPQGPGRPVDVCLTSSIIEVGIDIDRLSLLSVVGQPKTTSQYIQVTGRIGRRWWDRPGLIATIYGAGKPRDRSHFEQFQAYHSRLYAQVEPTSVTPFSPPALDRALNAVMCAYVRNIGKDTLVNSPNPVPTQLLDQLEPLIMSRVNVIDPEESSNCAKVFAKLRKEWDQWDRTKWGSIWQYQEDALMYRNGAYVESTNKNIAWAIPTSMRNVDASCEMEITQQYLQD